MFTYCNNGPVMRADHNGQSSISEWWEGIIDDIKGWLEEEKEEAENSEDGTTFVSWGAGLAFIVGISGLTGITTDNKGNVGIMTSWFIGGGTPTASINVSVSTTNAPTIDKQEGLAYGFGVSADVGFGAGGEFFAFEDPVTGDPYYSGAFVASAGISVPSDAHVGVSYSKIWFKFNVYDCLLQLCDIMTEE